MSRYGALLFLACATGCAQQYTISTLAGNGAAGINLYNPESVAIDSAGNIYFGDWNGAVRKSWARTQTISTVAGTGVPGYSGDGGQATSAQLGKIAGIALDSAGNIYIGDVDNNRIRRVDATTGIIQTIAGPNGVSQPGAVLVDAQNDIYFSNAFSRIGKIANETGAITTIAGQVITGFGGDGGPATSAEFWDPVPSAIAPNGDIYIADYENSRIRKISAATGIVTTVSGSGNCVIVPGPFPIDVCKSGFAGDGSLATNALLNYPESAALDSYGNLYIADTINHRIRLVDASTGIISTIAGTGTNGNSGDGGPALSAELGDPTSIAIDQSGRIYFADENNNSIRMLTPLSTQKYQPHDPPRRPRN
jgi:sugar lactone lactonase YvrE